MNIVCVNLNSLVRRTYNTSQLKNLLRSHGGQLRRVGRSRNWQMTVPLNGLLALIRVIESSGESSWLWVGKLLEQRKPKLSSDQLSQIAREHSNISVAQLVSLTDCTMGEARRAIDTLEWE